MRRCRRIWTIGCSCLTLSSTSWHKRDRLLYTSLLSPLLKNSCEGSLSYGRKGCWLRRSCWPTWRLHVRRSICIGLSQVCLMTSIWPRTTARWYWYTMPNGMCRYVLHRIRQEVIGRRVVWYPLHRKFTLSFRGNSLILWTIIQFC